MPSSGIGSMETQKLKPYHMENLYTTLSKTPCGSYVEGKKQELTEKQKQRFLSSTTIHEVHRLLGAAFQYAVEWGILVKSPVPVDSPKKSTQERTIWTVEEMRAALDSIYNSGNYKLAFSPAMQETLQVHQQDFMQEDAQAGMIYTFLEDYTGDRVCSKQLYAEALGNTNIPAEWETRAICEIMNTGISRGDIKGWQAHKTAKRYPKYGVQKGWERVTSPETGAENFSEITDAEAQQLGFPF